LTALDIVTAHSTLPGRETVALLLEEAMRGEGWSGGRMEEQRKSLELRKQQKRNQIDVKDRIGRVLEIDTKWWEGESDVYSESSDDEDEADDSFYASNVGLLVYLDVSDYFSDTSWRFWLDASILSGMAPRDFSIANHELPHYCTKL
jgi:hypothetical protein